jgi:hypothetical protein
MHFLHWVICIIIQNNKNPNITHLQIAEDSSIIHVQALQAVTSPGVIQCIVKQL